MILDSHAELVRPALAAESCELLHNPDWAEGIAASMRLAAKWARRQQARALLLAVCDQARLTGEHTRALCSAHAADGCAVASAYAGIRGSPAIFPAAVLDYARFLEFLLRGNPRVLSSAMHEAMLTSHGNTHEFGDYFGYGYGLVIGSAMQLGTDFYEERVVLHDGRIPGYLSLFALFPDAQFGVVVLVNSEAGIPGKLAIEQFVQLPPPQPLPADVLPDVARYPAYAGTYEDPHVAGTIVVTAQDGELHVAISAADVEGVAYDEVLQPTSLDNFVLVLDGQPLPVTFLKDDTGTYNLIRTRSLVAKRAAGAP